MKYIIRYTDTNPDGGTCGTMYYLAQTERDMERTIKAFAEGHPYSTVTCLGPIFDEMPKWMVSVINRLEE
jgi:hypothetical protein